MSFISADGTGLSTATSYTTLAYANTYADSFFDEASWLLFDALADSSKERFLNRATMYINDTYSFVGDRGSADQALEWPRDYAYNSEGDAVTGIPSAIKQATVLSAKRLLNSTELSPDLERGGAITSEKIDVITITYSEGASSYTKFTEIENLLRTSGLIEANRNAIVNARLTLR